MSGLQSCTWNQRQHLKATRRFEVLPFSTRAGRFGINSDQDTCEPTNSLIGTGTFERYLLFFEITAPIDIASNADVLMTQIIEQGDVRAKSDEFAKTMRKEGLGLETRNTCKMVLRDSVLSSPSILGGRFVLELKNAGTVSELAKARYVAQGHGGIHKSYMVHNITNLRQISTRIIISVAAIKSFRIFSHDEAQAYLQSEEQLTRLVFVLPKKRDMDHFRIAEEEIVELLRPIYSMTDAGDCWGVTVDHHTKDELGLVPLLGDLSLYIKSNDQDVDGLFGMCVDDGCLGGNEAMQEPTKVTLQKFESRPREWDIFLFLRNKYLNCAKQPFYNIIESLYWKARATAA